MGDKIKEKIEQLENVKKAMSGNEYVAMEQVILEYYKLLLSI